MSAANSLALFDPAGDQPAGSGPGIKEHDPLAKYRAILSVQTERLDDGPMEAVAAKYFAERAQEARAQTIADLRCHVKKWTAFWSALEDHRSLGPMVSAINARHLAAFQTYVQDTGDGNSAHRANQGVKALRQILKWAVKKGLRVDVPEWKPLQANTVAAKVHLAHERRGESPRTELQTLLDACDVARWPDDQITGPVHQWRTAVVLYVCYGFRTQDLVSYETDHDGLTWGDVRTDAASPAAAGKARFDSGWLVYTPQKTEWAKPQPIILPLHPVAREWLDAVRPPNAADSRPIFPWPRYSKGFAAAWQSICERAAETSGDDSFRDLEVRHLRKTCATWHAELANLNGRPDDIAEHVTGHAKRGIMDRHYASHEARLIEHFRWPQLAEWLAWDQASAPTERQTWLF